MKPLRDDIGQQADLHAVGGKVHCDEFRTPSLRPGAVAGACAAACREPQAMNSSTIEVDKPTRQANLMGYSIDPALDASAAIHSLRDSFNRPVLPDDNSAGSTLTPNGANLDSPPIFTWQYSRVNPAAGG